VAYLRQEKEIVDLQMELNIQELQEQGHVKVDVEMFVWWAVE
jgi:hypothetical protein